MIEIPLEILDLNNDGFHLLTEVVVFDKKFTAVVDTGASRTVLDKTTIEAYIEKETLLLSDKLSTGLGTNTMESYTLSVPEFRLGELIVPNFETAVLDLSSINEAYGQIYNKPIVGVIGGDILMKYGAIINYPSSSLFFSAY